MISLTGAALLTSIGAIFPASRRKISRAISARSISGNTERHLYLLLSVFRADGKPDVVSCHAR